MRLVSRGIRAGYRSNNFIIGLTNEPPAVKTPVLWKYDVCGQWPGVVGNGVTVHLRCVDNLPPRRYVIVQLKGTYHLNFCELQIYVRRMLSFTAVETRCRPNGT